MLFSSSSRNRSIGWLIVVLVWLSLIALSSTTWAGHWADSAFEIVIGKPFHLRSMEPENRSLIHFVAEKNVHLFLFTTLGALLYWIFGSMERRTSLVLGLGSAIGIGSDLLQMFFPKRDPSLRDVLINVTGVACGVGLSKVMAFTAKPKPLSPS